MHSKFWKLNLGGISWHLEGNSSQSNRNLNGSSEIKANVCKLCLNSKFEKPINDSVHSTIHSRTHIAIQERNSHSWDIRRRSICFLAISIVARWRCRVHLCLKRDFSFWWCKWGTRRIKLGPYLIIRRIRIRYIRSKCFHRWSWLRIVWRKPKHLWRRRRWCWVQSYSWRESLGSFLSRTEPRCSVIWICADFSLSLCWGT